MSFEPDYLIFENFKMFRNTFLKFRTGKAVKLNKSEHYSTPFVAANQVGILFSTGDESKLNAVKQFASQLESERKDVQILEYSPSKNELSDSGFSKFSLKSYNFWGNLENAEAQKFINQPFDYLFVIDQEILLPIQNILAQSKARCRVGRSVPGMDAFFDLMIEMTGDNSALIQGMINYTKKLS